MKLTKKDIASGVGLSYSPEWISNGHWMVKRELISNYDQFATPEIMLTVFKISAEDKTDNMIRFANECFSAQKEWIPTGIFVKHHDEDLAEIYLNGNDMTFFDIVLLKLLGLEGKKLIGDKPYSAFYFDQKIIIMPCRFEIDPIPFSRISKILKSKE